VRNQEKENEDDIIYQLCVEDILGVAKEMGIPRELVLSHMVEIKDHIIASINWHFRTKIILGKFKNKIQ